MSRIKTYCRIKPSSHLYEDYDTSNDTLHVQVPESLKDFESLNRDHPRVNYGFHFDHIFNPDASQSDVFDVVAKEIIEGFLSGYNGTIFAYGQTGTGKTYTIEGSARQYKERGLEPRALSMVYESLQSRQDEEISIHISYMEIYQEIGYDLLNPGAKYSHSLVTVFPKITVLEGPGGAGIIRNLSQHLAASEDVAHFLLLQGQANRHVAATTVHDRSSRSHAVFTIYLSARKQNSDVTVRSKLHLVDLAGSERASKTGIEGQQLTEAKSINLSLHHLETVIIALQSETAPSGRQRCSSSGTSRSFSEVSLQSCATTVDGIRGSKHIPYRNSQLTLVLRDSLGGNCMTAMIATVSLEYENLGEMLSTCRFASRVACIANTVKKNEVLDERIIIRRLRKRVADLETEVSCLRINQDETGSEVDEMSIKLTDEDKIHCGQIIRDYLRGLVNDPVTEGITSPHKFRECLKLLKKMIISRPKTDNNSNNANLNNARSLPSSGMPPGETSWKRTRDSDILWVHPDDHKPQRTEAWAQETVQRPIRWSKSRLSNPQTESPTLADSQNQPQKYKSPFEQKREQDILKLNNKVQKMQREREEKEEQMIEMKLHLAEQEVNVMEKHLRNMLQVAEQQVEDQKEYIFQLKSNETDDNLIQEEILVGKQLKKRQVKFERKLEMLAEKRKRIEESKYSTSHDKEMVEVPYEAYPHKQDGSLNTRQVFHLLKTEEKRQEEENSRIEQERVSLFSQQLQMKEEATRLKLQDLKESLRRSHSPGANSRRGNLSTLPKEEEEKSGRIHKRSEVVANTDDMDYLYVSESPLARPFSQMSEALNSEFSDGRLSQFSERPVSGRPFSQLSGRPVSGRPPSQFSSRPVSGSRPSSQFSDRRMLVRPTSQFSERPFSQMSGSSTVIIPDSEFYADRKKEKDPELKWNSPYSRPVTPSSFFCPDIAITSGQKQSIDPNEDNFEEEFQSMQVMDIETKPDSPEQMKESILVTYQGNDISGSVPNEGNDTSAENQFRDSLVSEDHKKETLQTEQNGNSLPSQYVHEMDGMFDPQKMDLSKSSFDSALATMLASNDFQTAMVKDHYNQFARQSRPRERPMFLSPYAASLVAKPAPRLPQNYVSPYAFPVVPREVPSNSGEEVPQEKYEIRGSPFTSKMTNYLKSPQKTGEAFVQSHQGEDESDEDKVDGDIDSDKSEQQDDKPKLIATDDSMRESSYMKKLQSQRDRVEKIRKARNASVLIQRAWRRHRKYENN